MKLAVTRLPSTVVGCIDKLYGYELVVFIQDFLFFYLYIVISTENERYLRNNMYGFHTSRTNVGLSYVPYHHTAFIAVASL